jgi:4-pyridoxate dehydrogenase
MRFDRIALAMIRAYVFGTGPGTVLPNCLFAFIKTKPDLAVPDIEFMFRAVSGEPYVWFPGIRPGFDDEIAIRPTLLHPKSRGEVLLRSTDPFDKPRIFNRFLQHPDDLQTLLRGARIALDIASRPPMAPFKDKLTGPTQLSRMRLSRVRFSRRTLNTYELAMLSFCVASIWGSIVLLLAGILIKPTR